ncbi:hypothetical protein [Paraburkholderia aromaticivorans]|uniref:hypothetical protein n=1 Tax=Paraburkholderia aromaticivorans TaxID=2026199 RepID=UPI001455ED5F|nr:hypothetical protein [Paraburkholderia aromaticivorans]
MPRGAITGMVNANLAIASSRNRDLPTNRADCAAGGILIFVADVELNDIKAMACSNRFRGLSFVFTGTHETGEIALLDRRETQMRRTIKSTGVPDAQSRDQKVACCPYAEGQKLWVREAHEVNRIRYEESRDGARRYAGVAYQADDGREQFEISPALYLELDAKESGGWTPSIYMPRWALRIALEVIVVRVERVQEISEADAIAEGCESGPTFTGCGNYIRLWDSPNAARGYRCDVNPWVWVIAFRRRT